MTILDKFPQWLNGLDVTESGAGLYTEDSIDTPVILEEAILMEIHRVIYCWSNSDQRTQIHLQIQGGQTTSFKPVDPEVIAPLHIAANAGAGTSVVELTDGSGRGILVASKELFLAIDSDGAPAAVSSASVKLLYRLVKVGKDDIIDILTE